MQILGRQLGISMACLFLISFHVTSTEGFHKFVLHPGPPGARSFSPTICIWKRNLLAGYYGAVYIYRYKLCECLGSFWRGFEMHRHIYNSIHTLPSIIIIIRLNSSNGKEGENNRQETWFTVTTTAYAILLAWQTWKQSPLIAVKILSQNNIFAEDCHVVYIDRRRTQNVPRLTYNTGIKKKRVYICLPTHFESSDTCTLGVAVAQ